MDMKRILQALDHAETKPVVGKDDMKKFLQVVTEGATPHKVALPVQMAMQHYQQPQQPTIAKSPIKTSVRKFFKEVELEVKEQQAEKKQLLRQYSQAIAERVLMREFKERPEEDDGKYFYKGDNPNIKGALTKARTNAPGAEDDIEALIIQGDRVASNLEKAQDQINRQQEREEELTDILSAAEQRFRDLNAKVAAGDISDQDVNMAKAAQEIEKDVDQAKSQVGQNVGNQDKPTKSKAIDKIKEPTVDKTPAKEKSIDQKPSIKKVNTTDAGTAIDKMVRTRPATPAFNTKDLGTAIDKMVKTPVTPPVPSDTSANPGFPFDPFAHTANTIRHMAKPDNPNLAQEKPVKDPNQQSLNLRRSPIPKSMQTVGRQSKASTVTPTKRQQAADIAKAAMAKAASKGYKYDSSVGFGNFDNIFGEPATIQENQEEQPVDQQPVYQQPVDQQPVDQQPVDQQPVDQQPQQPDLKRQEIDTNTMIIRRGLRDHLPKVDIHIDGEGITVYPSQMYAFIQSLGHLKNPKLAYERRDKILSTSTEWVVWVSSKPTRKWINHYDSWWDKERRKAKQQRLQATRTPELPLKETVLNYLATREGFPNWVEAKKILDESEFIDLLQHAARLIKQLKENEIPGHSMGFKPGPGGPGIMPLENQGKVKTIKPKAKTDPCWTGYQQIGMKIKNGKSVPNCVKK
jgi:hypothetical protein